MTRRILSNRPENRPDSLFLPVGSLDDLRNVAIDDIADKTMILVEEEGLYRYDYDSTEPEDSARVVVPTVGIGRWLRLVETGTGSDSSNRADLLQLDSLDISGAAFILNDALHGERAGGSENSVGILTGSSADNWVHVVDAQYNRHFYTNSGQKVYGRLTVQSTALTGTITTATDSVAVVGAGTHFVDEVDVGQLIQLTGDAETTWGEVANIADDTHLTLVDPYTGSTSSGEGEVGDWTVDFVSFSGGSESSYAFSSPTSLTLYVLKSYRSADLPLVSQILKPIGGVEVGGSSGGTGWDAALKGLMDGTTYKFTLAHDDVDSSMRGHLVVKNGMVMELDEDYTFSDNSGPGGEDEIEFLQLPPADDRVVVRYMRVS